MGARLTVIALRRECLNVGGAWLREIIFNRNGIGNLNVEVSEYNAAPP
jgi:hypothetical protein